MIQPSDMFVQINHELALFHANDLYRYLRALLGIILPSLLKASQRAISNIRIASVSQESAKNNVWLVYVPFRQYNTFFWLRRKKWVTKVR